MKRRLEGAEEVVLRQPLSALFRGAEVFEGGTGGFKVGHGLCLQIREQQGGQSVGRTASLVSGEKLVGTRHLQHYLHFQPFLMQATC